MKSDDKPDKPKKKRIARDYFKIDAAPEDVASVVMNAKPKKRGEWDFEKRD